MPKQFQPLTNEALQQAIDSGRLKFVIEDAEDTFLKGIKPSKHSIADLLKPTPPMTAEEAVGNLVRDFGSDFAVAILTLIKHAKS